MSRYGGFLERQPWQREPTGDPAESLTNPYWDRLKNESITLDYRNNPTIAEWTPDKSFDDLPYRHDFVGEFAWTITDPDTVAFVAKHCGQRVIDPMAGTGYWSYLLMQLGIDVRSYDLSPGANHWCNDDLLYVLVAAMDSAESAALHPDRTLLLSWPPYDQPAGARTIAAYQGKRIVYIGEGSGMCCGDDEMHEMLENDWTEVACHTPVQWFGLHDYVTVYDRKDT